MLYVSVARCYLLYFLDKCRRTTQWGWPFIASDPAEQILGSLLTSCGGHPGGDSGLDQTTRLIGHQLSGAYLVGPHSSVCDGSPMTGIRRSGLPKMMATRAATSLMLEKLATLGTSSGLVLGFWDTLRA